MEIIPTQKIINRDGIKAVKMVRKPIGIHLSQIRRSPNGSELKQLLIKNLIPLNNKFKISSSIQSAKKPCAQTFQSVGQPGLPLSC